MPRLAAAILGLTVVAAAMTGCGRPDEGGTALALEDPTWAGTQRVVGSVECADDVQVRVEPGTGTEGLTLVTATGRPKVGRCRVAAVIDLPPGTTRIEDAATGTVIDLPAR